MNKVNDLAKEILTETQTERGVYNYLLETYEQVKGKKLPVSWLDNDPEYGSIITNKLEFLKCIKSTVEDVIFMTETEEEE